MLVQSEADPLKEDTGGSADADHGESDEEDDPDIRVFNAHEVSGDVDGQADEDQNDYSCLIFKTSRMPELSAFLEKVELQHKVDRDQMKQY